MTFAVAGLAIPERIKNSLDRYAQHHVPTGGFLKAVLENDLQEAVARADEDTLMALRTICAYVYNELPSPCWGTREKVTKWLAEPIPTRRVG